MMYVFIIHYKLRKRLGPEWIDKTDTIALDDLPETTTRYEAQEMAKFEFHGNRSRQRTHRTEYELIEIGEA